MSARTDSLITRIAVWPKHDADIVKLREEIASMEAVVAVALEMCADDTWTNFIPVRLRDRLHAALRAYQERP